MRTQRTIEWHRKVEIRFAMADEEGEHCVHSASGEEVAEESAQGADAWQADRFSQD